MSGLEIITWGFIIIGVVIITFGIILAIEINKEINCSAGALTRLKTKGEK